MLKKFILIIALIFISGNSFSYLSDNKNIEYEKEIEIYWGEGVKNKIDIILDKWNRNVLLLKKNDLIISRYENVLKKIQKVLEKNISSKLRVVLLYLEYKVSKLKLDYITTSLKDKKENNISTGLDTLLTGGKDKLDLPKILLNYKTLKRNEILVPVSGTAYGVLGFYIKPLYADALLYSIVFKNEFGNEADYNVKYVYFVSTTGYILGKSKLVNGYVYFDFKKPIFLRKNWNNSFYLFVDLNKIKGENQTNKKIKFKLEKEIDTFKTKVITKVNGNEAYFVNSLFNSNTYIIRKSKPILTNNYKTGRLRAGSNEIFKFYASSTGDISYLKKLKIDVIVNRAYVETGNLVLYIDGKKYDRVNMYFDDIRGDIFLHMNFFNAGYKLTNKVKEFKIIANFTKVYNNGYILTQIKEKSNNYNMISSNYTGDYSLIYSDNSIRGILNENSLNYFTEAGLYIDSLKSFYLRNR